jgi:molybdopterin/thiamine biosynthesis adenylyltransferase
MKNLKDLKILQIGCGTIGGYLAQFLVQSGAGSGTGKLHLVDKDILSPANLGRHLLGYEWLTKYKAEACQEFLTQQHPQSKITYDCCNASKLFPRISQYDLVVNATGYDPFSYALNDHCLEMREGAPPVLHSWLAGNGVAAQSFFKEADFQTCYRCISTEVSGNQPRFPVLKDDVVEIEEGIMACGDGAYTPFPVSRSATAAAQALDAVLDWVNGNPSPRFRTQVLDSDKAFDVKNSNPEPLKACPACQTI